MFKRRDIPPVLLLLLLIILVMLTLSQILVVHNGRYGRSVHSMRKLQLELREMDVNLHALMMQNVPSIELNRRLLQNEINAHRFAEIISKASQMDSNDARPDLPSSRFKHRAEGRPAVSRATDDPDAGNETRDRQEESSSQKALSPVAQDYQTRPGHTNRHNSKNNNNDSGSDLRPRGRSLSGNDDNRTGAAFGAHSSSVNSMAFSRSASSVRHQQTIFNGTERVATLVGNEQAPRDLASPTGERELSGGAERSMKSRIKKGRMRYCPSVPPLLKGNIGVNLENSSRLTWDHVAMANPDVQRGGAWSPKDCVARHRVAIIIPYRDREQHLITLLYYLHPVLQRQQLDYRIYVVEQYGRDTFNKARIMNIAFVEALKQYHFQCFVFHDVDLVPEDDRNMYSCPQQPRHMSVAIDEMGYKLAYQELVGGVLNMRTEHFQRVNGYSNLYWGWGAEDDDMAYRIMHVGLKITRPPETTARYKMAKHTKRKPSDWRKRAKLLYTGTRRFQFDGLNSLQYKVTHIKEMPLYTHLLVDIGRPPRGF